MQTPGTRHAFYGVQSARGWVGFEELRRGETCGAADDGELSGEAKARANPSLQVPVDIKAPRLTLAGCPHSSATHLIQYSVLAQQFRFRVPPAKRHIQKRHLASQLRRRMRPRFLGPHHQLTFSGADGLTRLGPAGFGYELSLGIDHRNPRLLSRLAEVRGDLCRLHERSRLRDGVSSGAAEDHVGTRCPHDVKPEVVGVG